jgi:hypothetical protein
MAISLRLAARSFWMFFVFVIKGFVIKGRHGTKARLARNFNFYTSSRDAAGVF